MVGGRSRQPKTRNFITKQDEQSRGMGSDN